MGSKREIRASDQDRECAAEVLRDAFAVGCLDGGDLEQRGGAAYRARTLGELWDLTADLPGWLLDRPVALPDEYCYARPRRRMGSAWPWALILGLAVFWLIAIALAWAPLGAIPLVLVWLLVLVREQGLTPRAARRQARSPATGSRTAAYRQ
jgi:hypothetical protein